MELSPTRHWSVGRHIMRKHAGIGEPISINTHQTRIQMNIGSGWSNSTATTNPTQFNPKTNNLQRNGSRHQSYPNNNTFSAAQNNFKNEEIRRESPSAPSEKRGIIDEEYLEMFRQMVEIKKLRQNQSSSLALPTSVGDTPLQFTGRLIPSVLQLFFVLG
jgi:hypothetical protein